MCARTASPSEMDYHALGGEHPALPIQLQIELSASLSAVRGREADDTCVMPSAAGPPGFDGLEQNGPCACLRPPTRQNRRLPSPK